MYENENYDKFENVNASSTEQNTTASQNGASGERAADSVASMYNRSPYFDYTAGPVSGFEQIKDTKKKKEKKPKRESGKPGFWKKAVACVSLGLIFGVFAGAGFYGVMRLTGQLPSQNTSSGTVSDAGYTVEKEIPPTLYDNVSSLTSDHITYVQDDISDMVDDVMPAMVSIINNYTNTITSFWGQSYQEPSVASGSGIIVGETDEELLIATNNHVVEGADKLEVTFINQETAEAVIKGTDADMDLAVIAVSLKDMDEKTKSAITVANLGDSDNLRLGEPVVAIGNALGYGQSVTDGIVSALNREIENNDGTSGTFIQTNAAINPGNSGGALLNIKGEVIGINSSKIGGSTIEGMGYAIPISSASPILSELMERKTRVKVDKEEMGFMGITMQAVTSEISQIYGLPKGVFITDVSEDSPAEKAGIKKRDIIVKFDGQKIVNTTDLQEVLQYFRAGDEVKLTVKRAMAGGEYESVDLTIVLGERPKED